MVAGQPFIVDGGEAELGQARIDQEPDHRGECAEEDRQDVGQHAEGGDRDDRFPTDDQRIVHRRTDG